MFLLMLAVLHVRLDVGGRFLGLVGEVRGAFLGHGGDILGALLDLGGAGGWE